MKTINLLFTLFILLNPVWSQNNSEIDDQILKSIVRINNKYSNEAGTGFIVKCKNDQTFDYYLVLNKHLIGQWSYVDEFIPSKQIDVYFNLNGIKQLYLPYPIAISDLNGVLLKDVIVHPVHEIDIAIIKLESLKDLIDSAIIDIVAIDTSLLLNINELAKINVGLGCIVFNVGFFSDIYSKSNNLGTLRPGWIASSLKSSWSDSISMKTRSGEPKTAKLIGSIFLVAGDFIDGSSGGPIISPQLSNSLKLSSRSKIKAPIQTNYIIGINSANYTYYDNDIKAKFNAGLSVIYACEHILELIPVK